MSIFKQLPDVICQTCGKKFPNKSAKNQPTKYCSRECQYDEWGDKDKKYKSRCASPKIRNAIGDDFEAGILSIFGIVKRHRVAHSTILKLAEKHGWEYGSKYGESLAFKEEKKRMDQDEEKFWKQFEKLCAIQCTKNECASVLGVSEDTLERRLKEVHSMKFTEFFKLHSGKGRVALRRTQFKVAVDDESVPMLIHLGKQKTWLGQTETFEIASMNKNEHAYKKLTKEEAENLREAFDLNF